MNRFDIVSLFCNHMCPACVSIMEMQSLHLVWEVGVGPLALHS